MGKVEVTKEADFYGDIKAKSISVEDGAYFKGSIELNREPHRKSAFAEAAKGACHREPPKAAVSQPAGCQKGAVIFDRPDCSISKVFRYRALSGRLQQHDSQTVCRNARTAGGMFRFLMWVRSARKISCFSPDGCTGIMSAICSCGCSASRTNKPGGRDVFRHLDYPPRSFDGIQLWDLTDHLDDNQARRLVRRCFDMLRSTGLLMLIAFEKKPFRT